MLYIQARKGREGSVSVEIKEDSEGGLNFTAVPITRAVVAIGGKFLDTSSSDSSGDISFVANKVTFKKGAFDLTKGEYPVEVIIFNSTYPEGKTYIGEGFEYSIISVFDDVPLP
jgi:hypothetical protein